MDSKLYVEPIGLTGRVLALALDALVTPKKNVVLEVTWGPRGVLDREHMVRLDNAPGVFSSTSPAIASVLKLIAPIKLMLN
ncbi:MAG: hypothetical protein Ct9H300mP11_05950 [Chloroflexota bacterium]|nr:MAG: hypothetical protein Ct9H300mP11_05950 [Chloroflexota bacterium]